MRETLVRFIRSESFEQEVIAEKKPVLLLCMPRDEEFPQQLEVIEDIARRYGNDLKVGVLEEEFIGAFKENYGIVGTPTFLVLVGGKEKTRWLGLADPETLSDLISRS